VQRHDESLEVQVSKLFDGVYALQLDREEAYGPLNVTVSTTQKPRMKQNLEVDFGTPWLKVAGWKKAFQVVSDQFQRDFSDGQVKLRAGFERVKSIVEPALEEAAARARVEAAKLKQNTKEQSLKASAIASAKAQEWSKRASEVIAAHARLISSQVSERSARTAESVKTHASEAGTVTVDYSRYMADRASKTFTLARAQKQARILWVNWSGRTMSRVRRGLDSHQRKRSQKKRERSEKKRERSEKKRERFQKGSCGRAGNCRHRNNRR
jgi:hypothetical protein